MSRTWQMLKQESDNQGIGYPKHNPLKLERKLKRRAMKLFRSTKSERAKAYIYGTMYKTSRRPNV